MMNRWLERQSESDNGVRRYSVCVSEVGSMYRGWIGSVVEWRWVRDSWDSNPKKPMLYRHDGSHVVFRCELDARRED